MERGSAGLQIGPAGATGDSGRSGGEQGAARSSGYLECELA